jgi:hypothetical protein
MFTAPGLFPFAAAVRSPLRPVSAPPVSLAILPRRRVSAAYRHSYGPALSSPATASPPDSRLPSCSLATTNAHTATIGSNTAHPADDSGIQGQIGLPYR